MKAMLLTLGVALLPILLYLAFTAYMGGVHGWGLQEVKRLFGQAGAVVTVKSTVITNRDATPQVPSGRHLGGAPILHARGVAAIANGDSIASKYLICEIPSNAVPIAVRVSCPDIGLTTAADVGLYKTTRDGGAVVDADFFGSGVSLSGGALSKSDITYESGVMTVANCEKRIWEHLGLSADPQLNYDVVATLTGAADAAGSVLVEVDYVV